MRASNAWSCAVKIEMAVSVLALAIAVAPASGQERRIKRSELPPAVEKAVAAAGQDATIVGFSEERQKGHTYYEAELRVQGHSKDVLMDENGAVVEVEEEVALAALPAPVRDGLTARAGSGKLAKVESITKHGQLVAYEAQILVAGKKSEVQVGPDGKPLDHEE
jgi:hypothetical protein